MFTNDDLKEYKTRSVVAELTEVIQLLEKCPTVKSNSPFSTGVLTGLGLAIDILKERKRSVKERV